MTDNRVGLLQQGLDVCPFDADQRGRFARAHGGGARRLVKQGNFAENLARLQDGKHFARGRQYLDRTALDQIGGIARLAEGADGLTGRNVLAWQGIQHRSVHDNGNLS